MVSSITPGEHALYVLATFPLGVVKAYGSSVSYKPYDISAGYNFTCATTQPYGELYCWGSNSYGQLGAGSAASSSSSPLGVVTTTITPYPGPGTISPISDVSVGLDCACAVWNGGVICWGRNAGGILGVTPATLSSSSTPLTVIPPQSGVKNVSVGGNFACALYNNGDVKCWGYGAYGQLGTGSFSATQATPTTVMTGVTKVLTARDTTFFHKGSDVWTTGRDNYGQLGDGGGSVSISTPVKIITGGVSDLWSGWYHACARVSGTIKCWGANQTGEGGIGTAPSNLYSPTTTTVWGANPYITTMAGGDGTTCAYFQLGSALQCIGYNTSGQLGMGYTSSYELSVKTPSAYLSGVGINPTNGIYSGGWTHICAFDDGHYKCAGDNTYGQIGNPSAGNPQLTPYTVLGL
jgi:alpha-tubulin suppressor-like RCC1 family protein